MKKYTLLKNNTIYCFSLKTWEKMLSKSLVQKLIKKGKLI